MRAFQRSLADGLGALAGVGDVDVGATPREAVYRENKLTLYHYRPERPRPELGPLLIAYALVNRPTMVDLQPDRSLVRGLLDAGLDVYLDITHQSEDFIRSHFPTVHARCLALGFDLAREPIPVVPAAHYVCGGVMSDSQGRTDIEGLYAIGEVAFTGLHGANRMASNSLLECMVFAESASESIRAHLGEWPLPRPVADWDESRVTDSDEEVVVSHNWDELRRFMWDYVGIVRTTKRLQRAQHRAQLLLSEIDEYYGNFRVTNDLIELRNLAVVGNLIIESALTRHESRGLHYTLDYPEPNTDGPPSDTILTPPL